MRDTFNKTVIQYTQSCDLMMRTFLSVTNLSYTGTIDGYSGCEMKIIVSTAKTSGELAATGQYIISSRIESDISGNYTKDVSILDKIAIFDASNVTNFSIATYSTSDDTQKFDGSFSNINLSIDIYYL